MLILQCMKHNMLHECLWLCPQSIGARASSSKESGNAAQSINVCALPCKAILVSQLPTCDDCDRGMATSVPKLSAMVTPLTS